MEMKKKKKFLFVRNKQRFVVVVAAITVKTVITKWGPPRAASKLPVFQRTKKEEEQDENYDFYPKTDTLFHVNLSSIQFRPEENVPFFILAL